MRGALGIQPIEAIAPGFWSAHLAVIDRRALLDLALDSASSPTLGFELEPLSITVPPGFARGGVPAETEVNGTLVRYEAHPEDR